MFYHMLNRKKSLFFGGFVVFFFALSSSAFLQAREYDQAPDFYYADEIPLPKVSSSKKKSMIGKIFSSFDDVCFGFPSRILYTLPFALFFILAYNFYDRVQAGRLLNKKVNFALLNKSFRGTGEQTKSFFIHAFSKTKSFTDGIRVSFLIAGIVLLQFALSVAPLVLNAIFGKNEYNKIAMLDEFTNGISESDHLFYLYKPLTTFGIRHYVYPQIRHIYASRKHNQLSNAVALLFLK